MINLIYILALCAYFFIGWVMIGLAVMMNLDGPNPWVTRIAVAIVFVIWFFGLHLGTEAFFNSL